MIEGVRAFLQTIPLSSLIVGILILAPILLLLADIVFKWAALGKGAPRDSVADLQLAALSINVVHFATKVLSVSGPPVVMAFGLVILQAIGWFGTLFLVKYLEGQENVRLGLLYLSYLLGIGLFAIATTTMQVLLLPL